MRTPLVSAGTPHKRVPGRVRSGPAADSARNHARLRHTVAVLGLCLWAVAVAAADTAVPRPDLSGAAEPVREALSLEVARMTELLDGSGDADALAAGWMSLGDSYFAHDYFAEALVAYRAALELVGDQAALAYRVGLAHMAEGRLESAIPFYTIAADTAPADSLRMPTLVRRGRALLDRGDTQAALVDFREAVRLAPESPAALGGLGRAELAAGDAEAALSHLSRAIEIDPAATRLRQPLGMAYRALGDRDAARAALAGVGDGEPTLADPVVVEITRRSRSPQFFLQSGLSQADRGDYDAAAALIGRAAALAPENLSILSSYGHVLAEAGRYELARKALERVTATDAAAIDDWLYLGGIEQAEGQAEAAELAFRNAVALDPDSATAQEALARLALNRNAFGDARAAYVALAEATRDAGARGRLFYWAGMAALGAGDCDGALQSLGVALAVGPPYDPALVQALARTRATCPDVEPAALKEALDWSEQIYSAVPGLESSATLAMVYAALERYTDAVDLQTQAIFEALKTGALESRSGLQVDMMRYREGRPAERAYRATDPLFRMN